jgi:hypothetical protein
MRQATGSNGIRSQISTLRGWISPDEQRKKPLLYVSDQGAGTVNIYSVPQYAEIGKITSGVEQPAGLATDKKGDLYVANIRGDTVTVYKPRQTSPFRTLTETGKPDAVAVGSNGYAYAGDMAGGIDVYPPGATAPSNRLTNTDLEYGVTGVGVDASNNVYGAGAGPAGGVVVEFVNASGGGRNLGLKGLAAPTGAIVDKNKNLIVSDFAQSEVLTYPPGKKSPSSTFFVETPAAMNINRKESEIYAPGGGDYAVGVYDYPSGTFVTSIDIGNFTDGVAVSP